MAERTFVALPPERAWTRRLLCAAEIVDAVTLRPVSAGLKVRADGLRRNPFVNGSGVYCWLEEGGAQPSRIVVDATGTVYADAESAAPVPPAKSLRIELVPRFAYPFPGGATALRGTLRVSRFGTPRPITGASIQLQWSDGAVWIDAPTRVTTDRSGDFAVPLRLAPKQEPRLVSGSVAVRLRVDRAGSARTSDELSLRAGQVSAAPAPFVWEDLHP